ncbi:hypothetical protein Esi_0105_0050 [Ectocarpus siliculosus]|uniref:Uncharacterized protein n=1 Tax=Ectocarpus siliculosus TaxID=2880 RepID=D7FH61_ECTSI|nr:hypothetical protein Esi_0105_0050 [Ectocarpus siliculosus]|eukprot:CBJ28436.1 hypothetical protein Esi_0105_0050 [Ectocarpus siliculosus]
MASDLSSRRDGSIGVVPASTTSNKQRGCYRRTWLSTSLAENTGAVLEKQEKERKDAASTPSIASIVLPFFGRPQARKSEKPDVDTGSNRPAPGCTVVLSDDESGPASDPAAGDGAGGHEGGCVGDGGSDAGEYVGECAGENGGDGAEEQGGTVGEMEQGSYGGGGSVDDVDDGQLPPCPGGLYTLPDSNRLPVADYPFCLHGNGQTPLPSSCTIQRCSH